MTPITDEDRATAREALELWGTKRPYPPTPKETVEFIAQVIADSREASATHKYAAMAGRHNDDPIWAAAIENIKAQRAVLADEDLAAMMERYEAATEGPWHVAGGIVIRGGTTGTQEVATPPLSLHDNSQAKVDADFIAHAREDLPRVISSLVVAKAENERLRKLDAQSRASGCWCDEYGHPCKACSDKQELTARLAEAEAKAAEIYEGFWNRGNELAALEAQIESLTAQLATQRDAA